jgi:hypothetical protein
MIDDNIQPEPSPITQQQSISIEQAFELAAQHQQKGSLVEAEHHFVKYYNTSLNMHLRYIY